MAKQPTLAVKRKLSKELVVVIEYRLDPEEIWDLGEALERLRETGSAEIIDIKVEPIK